ncbi:hypothetical protein LXL04_006578 [Taraxacum kok-saghyz]
MNLSIHWYDFGFIYNTKAYVSMVIFLFLRCRLRVAEPSRTDSSLCFDGDLLILTLPSRGSKDLRCRLRTLEKMEMATVYEETYKGYMLFLQVRTIHEFAQTQSKYLTRFFSDCKGIDFIPSIHTL